MNLIYTLMKYLKLYEAYHSKESYLDWKNELIQDLKRYNIKNYIINSDGSIDVNGEVDLTIVNILHEIPFKFNKVSGNFNCYSLRLKSLKGCPTEVGGDFVCVNNELTSLEGAPAEIGGDFVCYNNILKNLIGSPEEVGGNFDCANNELISLEGCPAEIGGNFDCQDNKLTSLDCASNIKGSFDCQDNRIDPNNNGFFGHIDGEIIYEI